MAVGYSGDHRLMMRISALCLLISVSWPYDLQAEMIYTWQDCVKEAQENHPDLIAARESTKQSEAGKDIAKSGLFPSVSGDIGTTSSKRASSDVSENYSYGFSGSQLLFDGFKTINELKEAQQELAASRFGYMVSSSNIRLRLRNAFVKLLKEQQLVKITDEIALRRHDSLELVKLRYDAGREHKGALLLAQANFAKAQADVSQARRSISLAQRRLNKELGHSKFRELAARGDFSVTDLQGRQPDFEQLAETTPFLKELMAQKEAAKHGLRSAKAEYFPEVFASADIGRSESDWPPGNEAWSMGISVSMPFFDGGSRRASVKRARSSLTQAGAQERSGRDGVVLTLHETWASLQDAMDNVEVQKKFLESAEARAKISEAQYSNGLISFDDWIVIEDALVNAKKNFLEAQAGALTAEASWIQAKGGTLDNEN